MRSEPVRKRRMRIRYTNRFKCLLCYLVCFSLPLLWQLMSNLILYPYKLAGTAPNVTEQFLNVFPFLRGALGGLAAQAAIPAAATAASLSSALAAREEGWLAFLALCTLLAWLLTLLVQLLWRFLHRGPLLASRALLSAIRAYRLTMLCVLLINAAFAATVWYFGLRHVAGRTPWDFFAAFGSYVFNLLAAFFVSRFAAPPTLSGKHAFFKRL